MKKEDISALKTSIDRLEKKKSNIYFYLPNTQQIAVSIWETYFVASVLKSEGYSTFILTDDEKYEKPFFVEDNLRQIDTIYPKENTLSVRASDFIVIPDYFKDVLGFVKDLPAKKIIWVSSVSSLLLNHTSNMQFRANFNVSSFLVSSEKLANLIRSCFMAESSAYSFNIIEPTIPKYFEEAKTIHKKPIIGFVSRNSDMIKLIATIFYKRYPIFQWVTFEPLANLKREDFAKKLGESTLSVWIDEVSTFGTFPFESIAAGTYPIMVRSKINDNHFEFWKKNDNLTMGSFAQNFISMEKESNGKFNDVPEKIFETLVYFLLNDVSSSYTEKLSWNTETMESYVKPIMDGAEKRKKITNAFKNIFGERINELKKIQTNIQNESKK